MIHKRFKKRTFMNYVETFYPKYIACNMCRGLGIVDQVADTAEPCGMCGGRRFFAKMTGRRMTGKRLEILEYEYKALHFAESQIFQGLVP